MITAIAHFCVFNYLHGRVAATSDEGRSFRSTSIPQSYVTTISLLLVTVFRASLVASIGVCYAQCLWKTLRRELLEVQHIEELFQIRANALRLFNPALLRHSSSLVLLATMSWPIPVATIYPPGALTIVLESLSSEKSFNISVTPWEKELSNLTIFDMPRGTGYRDMLDPTPYKSYAVVSRTCSAVPPTSDLSCWVYR